MPSLPREIERVHDAYTPPPVIQTMKRNKRKSLFAGIVDRLTLVGQVVSKVEFSNALLVGVVELLFDTDVDGEFANFDIDGRVIVPLPWGSRGCYKWNVRTSEAKALRYIMLKRSNAAHAWIVYRPESRGWYITQRTSRHAFAMLNAEPITNEEWRRAWAATKTAWAAETFVQG